MSEADFLANSSPQWIETLYNRWIQDPSSVPSQWQLFFSGFALAEDGGAPDHPDEVFALKVAGVQSLISRYRSLGHLLACTDPLTACHATHPFLELSEFGLTIDDLTLLFPTRRFGNSRELLAELIESLKETYCRGIGVEFMHIQEPEKRQWLIDQMESCSNHPTFTDDDKMLILEKLEEANQFEMFLQRRFPGQKRFSLEGGEVLIPALYTLLAACPEQGVRDVVMGMPHRGRLNVLAHIFGKPYETIFAEFSESIDAGFSGDGDVKYHKGYSSDKSFAAGSIHLTLASNPSHLEAVNPVVEGKCRARQDRYGGNMNSVLPLIIHGDAAFSGQGSVMETLTLSRLDGYTTAGTIHLVLNNQIGFTTNPKDSRSTTYATDVAKMLHCPIFHVHGESPEMVCHAMLLALRYRQKFGRDVVIEIICYRRHGHNEADEPVFTQPQMYKNIEAHPPVNELYSQQLAMQGIEQQLLEQLRERVAGRLESALDTPPKPVAIGYGKLWDGISSTYSANPVQTAVSMDKLLLLSRKLAEFPPGFTPHPKIAALVQKRFEAVLKSEKLDWGTAETLAYATLLDEGVPVRLSGEDSQRGTFSHRHSVLHDIHDSRTVTPLAKLANGNALFHVWDSPLSEFGVLGFEYGYSLENPHGLTIWEAQFGDFANGAQVVIDQFIASGETKWNRASGLTLLLPHGFEGQGGEHSSARIERFLQLCANDNLLIVNPSTPAQFFHLLRKQVKQPFRKPLIVFTPKSLLRHSDCVSPCSSLSDDQFHTVLADNTHAETVKRVLLCSGKIYYDLMLEKTRRNETATALVRIEQLYPFHSEKLLQAIAKYPDDACFVWVQEEPENMGAWRHLQPELTALFGNITYVGRPADSSPAVGSHKIHQEQQEKLVMQAFSN